MNEESIQKNQVPFGFRDVQEDEKQTLVNDVFAKAAARYDQMNDLMSFGLHRMWKDDFIKLLNPPSSPSNFHVLDVAGGTGDIALRILRNSGTGTHVTLLDMSPEMLREGCKRADNEGLRQHCSFSLANAEALPFSDKIFDAYTIAFGLRNVTHVTQALKEAYRVLKPGARFLCLEFSTPDIKLLTSLYDAYSFTVIPALGKIVTGDGQPYRYLVESIRTFPKQDELKQMIAEAGFVRANYRNLSGGIVAIHWGWRL